MTKSALLDSQKTMPKICCTQHATPQFFSMTLCYCLHCWEFWGGQPGSIVSWMPWCFGPWAV
jgi:hypothetical protein